ncbi:MAG: hypothetical protein JST68_25265 [Bacteroidetes bacterium]|nr:hypothetical protein [Bacteroidota bacterium]
MQSNLNPARLGIIIFALFTACRTPAQVPNSYPTIGAIPTPAGFHRQTQPPKSFAAWLHNIPLKKDRTVYLYNGRPKQNQDAQFAVLDVSVGRQDLQQCADAVMRLRAEYLYAYNDYTDISFYTEQGSLLNFQGWLREHSASSQRTAFDQYLNRVFTYCSTRTLEKQLQSVTPFSKIQAGDVLIRSGAPGHAMQVVDEAEDAQGHRIFLLAQSYMPAQDIHIVKNTSDPSISPWYRANTSNSIVETPEWIFKINELKKWSSVDSK